MNQFFVITAGFLLGSIVLYIARVRTKTTIEMQNLLVRLADSIYNESMDANQQNEIVLLKFHNLLVETAALAPGIASGVVVASKDSFPHQETEAIEDFFNRNAWALPYAFTASLAISRLDYHARPLSVKRIKDAVFANMVMKFFSNKNGLVRLLADVHDTTRKVEQLTRAQPKNWNDLVSA